MVRNGNTTFICMLYWTTWHVVSYLFCMFISLCSAACWCVMLDDSLLLISIGTASPLFNISIYVLHYRVRRGKTPFALSLRMIPVRNQRFGWTRLSVRTWGWGLVTWFLSTSARMWNTGSVYTFFQLMIQLKALQGTCLMSSWNVSSWSCEHCSYLIKFILHCCLRLTTQYLIYLKLNWSGFLIFPVAKHFLNSELGNVWHLGYL